MLPKFEKSSGIGDIISQKMEAQKQYKEDEGDAGLKAAAAEIMRAVESKDIDLLVKSFRAMCDLCMMEEEPEDESEGPGGLLISGSI